MNAAVQRRRAAADRVETLAVDVSRAKTAATAAELRTATPLRGESFILSGHATQGDGGGAVFYYDPADTTTADDDSTCLVTTGGHRLKKIDGIGGALTLTQGNTTNARGLYSLSGGSNSEQATRDVVNAIAAELVHSPRVINVKHATYGAVGDGTTDDTAALQAAINAGMEQKRPVYIPAGTYKVTDTLTLGTTIGARQAIGLTVFGDAFGRTKLLWGANSTPTIPKYRTNCSTTAGSPTLTFGSAHGWTSDDIGKTIHVRDAGPGGHAWVATIQAVPTATTATLSSNATGTTNGKTAQIVPTPMIWFRGAFECSLRDMTLEGQAVSGQYNLAEAVRFSALDYADSIQNGATVSTRSTLRRVQIGGCKIGVRIYGANDANNDYHELHRVTISNYETHAITVENSQCFGILAHNCVLQAAGAWTNTTVSGVSMTSGQSTITCPAGTLTEEHVGQMIEVAGAGPAGARLATTVASIQSTTQATLSHNATTTAANTTLRKGAQCGVWCANAWGGAAGSIKWTAGFFGTHFYCDVYPAHFNGGIVEIDGPECEGSRALLETPLSGATQRVIVKGVRFSGDQVVQERPAINWRCPGQLIIEGSEIGQSTATPVCIGIDTSSAPEKSSVAVVASRIMSSLTEANVWTTWSPTAGRVRGDSPDVIASFLSNGSGTFRLARVMRDISALYGYGASQTAYFGYGDTLKIEPTQNTTITLANLPHGFGGRCRVHVHHIDAVGAPGGPWTLSWSPSVTWIGGRAPTATNSRAGGWDIYEFWREGATIYGLVIAQAIGSTAPRQTWGTASPENAVTGNVGDTFINVNGGQGTTFYVKESGANTNTGWTAK